MHPDVADAREEFAALGYDPLPLPPNARMWPPKGWRHTPALEQWRDAPADANIGLRCGGALRVAVIDTDDDSAPGTAERVTRYLAGLGLDGGDYPAVATPSGGAHFYFRLTHDVAGAWRKLPREIGAGELRFGCGAYVAAPPSVIGQARYHLMAGDWRQLPPLAPADLLPLAPALATLPRDTQDAPARISRRAWALLRGEGSERYRSLSEHEQAVITSLINSGLDFHAILTLFKRYPAAGKFAELYATSPKQAEAYLRHSFGTAARFARSHTSPARRLAAQAVAWAIARAWPGRTGATDKAVFLAHADIAHAAGRTCYAASCRDLGERAQVDKLTAARATRRLIAAGALALEKTATVSLANMFRLSSPSTLPPNPTAYTPIPLTLRECTQVAFRGDRTAGQVWDMLQGGPLTVAELAERTGRRGKTIARALARMARIVDGETGEVIPLVTQEGEKWRACGGVDLGAVARASGAAEAAERQKARHVEERRRHKEVLARGK